MTASTATLTDRTFGVEVECYLPANVTRGQLSAALRRVGVRARCETYNHQVAPSWKITTDLSLPSNGVEVVSPVLSGEAGIEQVRRVMNAIKALGCTVDVRCGLHVHVYAGDLSLDELKNVAINFVQSETAFDAIMPPSRRGDKNVYIYSNRTGFGGATENEQINRAIDYFKGATSTEDLMRRVSQGSDGTVMGRASSLSYNRAVGTPCTAATRYRKLNTESFFPSYGRPGYKTLEFRQHGGTVEAGKVTNWVRFCVAFIEGSRRSCRKPRKIGGRHDVAYELHSMFRHFNLPAETRAFFRARRMEFIDRAAAREASRLEREAARAEQARLAAEAAAVPATPWTRPVQAEAETVPMPF